MSHRYAELTSPEAGEAIDRGNLLLLPVGAVEQHGHALPLGTDCLRADAAAQRMAERLGGRAHVMPTLSYGISPHHNKLPGTITLPPALQVDLIVAVAESAADQGWRKMFVINGHGGNNAGLSVAQQTLMVSRPELIFAHSPITPLAENVHASLRKTEVTGHAGESETAQVRAIAPHLIREDLLAAGATELTQLTAKARLSRDRTINLAVTFDTYAPNGILGDPRTVTAEDGEKILDEVVGRLVAFAEELLLL